MFGQNKSTKIKWEEEPPTHTLLLAKCADVWSNNVLKQIKEKHTRLPLGQRLSLCCGHDVLPSLIFAHMLPSLILIFLVKHKPLFIMLKLL